MGGGVVPVFLSLFWFSSDPWSLTKILKPLVAFLRKKGIRIIVYLDDFLILNQSKEGAERSFTETVEVLQKIVFLINWKKSLGVAAQQREFLGLLIDSESLSLSLRPLKIQQIVEMCQKAWDTTVTTLREVAKILGNLAWAIQAIPFAQGHYRCVQRQFLAESSRAVGDLSKRLQLDRESLSELDWWVNNVERVNDRPLSTQGSDLIIFSDASLSG
jgi:hypothetical protein